MADTTSYKKLGPVNTRQMFRSAMDGRYAVPACNYNNMEHKNKSVLGSAGKA